MLRVDSLYGILVAFSAFQECRIIKDQMSKTSKSSKHLLQHGMASGKKEERKGESKWHRLLSLRKGSKTKAQCHGGKVKVSPISRISKHERRRRTVSEIIINVLESDSDNDCHAKNCETELNSSFSEGNSNGVGSDGNDNAERRSGKARSLDETSNGNAFQRTSRQSTFDEKITPIGRLLVPVRQEGEIGGESGYGFNSLFISPESPLETTAKGDTSKSTKEKLFKIRRWLEPAENAVNLKIFGGDRGLKKEKQRMSAFSFLIHPYSAFR